MKALFLRLPFFLFFFLSRFRLLLFLCFVGGGGGGGGGSGFCCCLVYFLCCFFVVVIVCLFFKRKKKSRKKKAIPTLNDEVNRNPPRNSLPCPPQPGAVISPVDRLGEQDLGVPLASLALAPRVAEGHAASRPAHLHHAVVLVKSGRRPVARFRHQHEGLIPGAGVAGDEAEGDGDAGVGVSRLHQVFPKVGEFEVGTCRVNNDFCYLFFKHHLESHLRQKRCESDHRERSCIKAIIMFFRFCCCCCCFLFLCPSLISHSFLWT